MKKNLLTKIKNTCQKSGVYLFKDGSGRIIYIGKALNLKKRLQSHLKNKKSGSAFLEFASELECIETTNEKEAMLLENELIKKYQPKFNVQWRDDKSFFWVNFSDGEWPKVEVIHQKKINSPYPPLKKRGGVPSLDSREGSAFGSRGTESSGRTSEAQARRGEFNLIGPFVSGRELRKTLRALRKILPFKTCKNPYEKPCLQWHIGLCPAHSPGLLPERADQASRRLNQNPSTSSRKAGFRSGNKIAYLDSLNVLRQFLRLYAGRPIRVEAYDISNIQGVYATGSMIVFHDSKPKKSEYRKFRIKTVSGANDVAMIKEVLTRRFNHPEWPYPDLILIDGGLAQLHAASTALQIARHTSQIISQKRSERFAIGDLPFAIMALAKREEEIYTEYSSRGLKISALPETLQNVFKHIRDEAHRFAIFYYRFLHGRQFTPKTGPRGRKKAGKSRQKTR